MVGGIGIHWFERPLSQNTTSWVTSVAKCYCLLDLEAKHLKSKCQLRGPLLRVRGSAPCLPQLLGACWSAVALPDRWKPHPTLCLPRHRIFCVSRLLSCFKFNFISWSLCMSCLHVYPSTMCISGAHRGPKRVLGLLELGL